MSFDGSTIDVLLGNATASGVYPGVTASAATADDVLYEGGAGDGVAIDQPMRVASMTKAMTTAAVLQLVDRGQVDLDAAVATYCPAFGELKVLDGFDGDEPRLRAPASQATVRQLLNHTSGCGYSFLNEKLTRYHELTGAPDALTFQRGLLDIPLVHDPGTTWEYGTSTDWAGQVVEAVSGQRLDDFMAENLWGPLGMTGTSFVPDDATHARLIPLHSRLEDGSLVPNGVELPRVPEICSGGGGGYSTAPDYTRFMRMLLRGGELDGERILQPATVDLMFTPSLGDLALPEIIRTTNPALSNDVPSLPLPQDWGLGLHLLLADVPGMRQAGTGDWAGLTNCYYWVDRASGVCGAILTQVFPFFDQKIVETAMAFEAQVYAQVGAAVSA